MMRDNTTQAERARRDEVIADHSREATITELGFDELLPVSGGQACAGAHYDKVVLAMRKAGGDPN